MVKMLGKDLEFDDIKKLNRISRLRTVLAKFGYTRESKRYNRNCCTL